MGAELRAAFAAQFPYFAVIAAVGAGALTIVGIATGVI